MCNQKRPNLVIMKFEKIFMLLGLLKNMLKLETLAQLPLLEHFSILCFTLFTCLTAEGQLCKLGVSVGGPVINIDMCCNMKDIVC